MIRAWRPAWRPLLFAAAFLLALLATLPMRLAVGSLHLEDRGFAAARADGTIWRGRFAGARFGPVPLGDVKAGLGPLPLLIGRTSIAFEEAEGRLWGRLDIHGDALGLADANGALQVELPGLPPMALDLSGLTVRFENRACREAEGRVSARVGGLAMVLAGEPACDGAALLLPLLGSTGGDRLTLRVRADGHWRAEASLASGPLPYSGRLEGRF